MDHAHRETETPGLAGVGKQPSGRSDLAVRANGQSLSPKSLARAHRRARSLGWFSLGLGLTRVLAPRGLARAIGLGDNPLRRRTMRLLGLGEVISGIGILGQRRPTRWVLARLAGDLVDLALLGRALTGRNVHKQRLPVAIASVLGVGALDFLTSRQLRQADRQGLPLPRSPEVGITRSITVNRPPEEVYRFWRNFQNLPRFMSLLDSVEVMSDRRSRWKVAGPRKRTLQWETEITEDRAHERIAWRSSENAPLESRGEVRFRRAPGGRGTEVMLTLAIDAPAAGVARLMKKVPEVQVSSDLRRFKQLMELGEVVRSDASVHVGPHPARPSSDENRD
jgi:uncharacterized membrane protein